MRLKPEIFKLDDKGGLLLEWIGGSARIGLWLEGDPSWFIVTGGRLPMRGYCGELARPFVWAVRRLLQWAIL